MLSVLGADLCELLTLQTDQNCSVLFLVLFLIISILFIVIRLALESLKNVWLISTTFKCVLRRKVQNGVFHLVFV